MNNLFLNLMFAGLMSAVYLLIPQRIGTGWRLVSSFGFCLFILIAFLASK